METKQKISIGVVLLVIIGLVIALGYIASRNFGGIPDLFKFPRMSSPYQSTGTGGSMSGTENEFTPIRVTTPQGGAVFVQGSVHTFTWNGGGPIVSLSLQRGSFLSGTHAEWKAQNIKNTGSYTFYVPTYLSGEYTLFVTDGDKKGYSKSFTIEGKTSSTGWTVYKDTGGLFEIQYPTKVQTSVISQKDTYPQKQYNVTVPDFIRGIQITASSFSKKIPAVSVVVFSSRGMSLDNWISAHEGIKRGYASQTRKTYNGAIWYKFSQVKADITYMRGRQISRERTDVPQELYLTIAGAYTYAILIDFGPAGTYTMQSEDIIKTFRSY